MRGWLGLSINIKKEIKNMKIAVSSKDKDINSEIDDIFGRCPYFIIAEIEGKEIKKVVFVPGKLINIVF